MPSSEKITTFPILFSRLALALLTACLCLLPGTNTALPFSMHDTIVIMTMIAFVCSTVARVADDDLPAGCERWVWAFAILLSAYGWAIANFPSAMVDRSSGSISMLDVDAWSAFGSVDQLASTSAMTDVSAVLMLLLMAIYFGRDRISRVIIAVAVTMSGLVASLCGLWLRGTNDLGALWNVLHVPSSVFGLFWYHGNAAAYLNLTWPVGLWLFITLIHERERKVARQILFVFAAVSVLVQVLAVLVNVSKMGHAVLLIEWILLTIAFLLVKKQHDGYGVVMSRFVMIAMLCLVVMGTSAWMTGANDGWKRWEFLSAHRFDDPARRHVAAMAIEIGKDDKWTGRGPGTFEWISPHYAASDPVLMAGRWRHAHNDFAQFFAEWGIIGYVIVFGTLLCPLMLLLRSMASALRVRDLPKKSMQRSLGLSFFVIAMTCLLAHSLIDFPMQIMASQFQFVVLAGLAFALSLPPHRLVSTAYQIETKDIRS
jgi:hypothetical protein